MSYQWRGAKSAESLHRIISGLAEENRELKARLRAIDGTRTCDIPEEQALRLARHMAVIAMRDDPHPHGVYGGPAGLEIAAKETALWDKRYRARKARSRTV